MRGRARLRAVTYLGDQGEVGMLSGRHFLFLFLFLLFSLSLSLSFYLPVGL
jgi:hypothetical protein